jgi:hypothetical protein
VSTDNAKTDTPINLYGAMAGPGPEMAGPTGSVGSLTSDWRPFRTSRVLLTLLIPLAVLVAINVALLTAIHYSSAAAYPALAHWYSAFDNNAEHNVPSWYNAALWMLTGLVSGYLARHTDSRRGSWRLFSGICFFFSLDETVSIHERLEPLGRWLESHLPFHLAFAWVIPGVIIAGLIVAVLLPWLFSLPPRTRNWLLIGGIVFILGSVGIETITGMVFQDVGANGVFGLLSTVEETFEMTGISICIAALLMLVRYQRAGDITSYRVDTTKNADSAAHR